jgi:hypothetical protein
MVKNPVFFLKLSRQSIKPHHILIVQFLKKSPLLVQSVNAWPKPDQVKGGGGGEKTSLN